MKNPCTISMPAFLALVTAIVDLGQRLLLLQAIEHPLAAALDAEHHGPAMGLGHRGKQMLGDGIDPAFDAPLGS